MQTEKVRRGEWRVTSDGDTIAEIYLDPWDQVDELILRTKHEHEKEDIKRLVLSHAAQFVKRRTSGNPLLICEHRNPNLSEADSDTLMDFSEIPKEFEELSVEVIDERLKYFVKVVKADYRDVAGSIMAATLEILRENEILVEVTSARPLKYLNRLRVEFSAPEGKKFRFWKHEYKPAVGSEKHQLHIIPAYHPCMQGKECKPLVNGATDAVIGRSREISSLLCPKEAVTRNGLFGSWSSVNHPFYAEGSSFSLDVSETLGVTEAFKQAVKGILKGALGLGDAYVGISGGFNPPYRYPQSGGGKVRGSEHACVWEYRTLEKEGELDGALIPPWFHEENWLNHIVGPVDHDEEMKRIIGY